jgi:hypothetical protein
MPPGELRQLRLPTPQGGTHVTRSHESPVWPLHSERVLGGSTTVPRHGGRPLEGLILPSTSIGPSPRCINKMHRSPAGKLTRLIIFGTL